MAAKTKTRSYPVGMKPVISSDVMGNRNVEIRPVGAWVQPASEQTTEEYPNAILAAAEEEDRILNMQREKQERLRRFQEDVKKRVRHLSQLKKQQQAKNMVQSLENERHMIRQSTLSAERLSARRDRCLVRKHQDLSISSKPNVQGGWVSECKPKKTDIFCDQTNQVHEFTSEARRKLGGRQMMTEASVTNDLPGGVWRGSQARDSRVSRDSENEAVNTDGSDLEDDEEGQEKFRRDEQEEERDNRIRRQLKTVQFDLSTPRGISPLHHETRRERLDRTRADTELHVTSRKVRVPEIYMGVAEEEERRHQRGQAALYRRMFMDQEREQVKENLRRQQHRKRIQKLKQDKEVARRQEEELAHRLVQPRDPGTGETSDEAFVRDQLEQTHMRDILERNEQRRRRNREMERYVEALRHRLREKIEKRGIQLPALCCCGLSLWDTNPETCANNCFYYKNPRAYAKALHSLLVSCEVER